MHGYVLAMENNAKTKGILILLTICAGVAHLSFKPKLTK